MNGRIKFKPRQSAWILFLVSIIIVLVAIHILYGEKLFEKAFAIVTLLLVPVHLLVLFRTGNTGHLIATLYYSCLSLTFFMPGGTVMRKGLAILTAIFLVFFIVVLFRKRLNWRYREILELAARPVNESQDGFSTPPFPAGEGSFSKEEILGFARFMIKHVIAYPFIEGNRVVLVIPQNMFSYLIFFKRDYRETTHVIFDFDGQVTVFISRKDYRHYVKEWTFDKLCLSLGDLFRTFLDLYQQGQGREIIRTLNHFRPISDEHAYSEQEMEA